MCGGVFVVVVDQVRVAAEDGARHGGQGGERVGGGVVGDLCGEAAGLLGDALGGGEVDSAHEEAGIPQGFEAAGWLQGGGGVGQGSTPAGADGPTGSPVAED